MQPIFNRIRGMIVVLGCCWCWQGCQQQKPMAPFSRQDTIAVIQAALADPPLDSILARMSSPGESLELIINPVIQPDYKILFRGKPVKVVAHDSTRHKPGLYPVPAPFFAEVAPFTILPNHQINLGLFFPRTGRDADLLLEKVDDQWRVRKRVFGYY